MQRRILLLAALLAACSSAPEPPPPAPAPAAHFTPALAVPRTPIALPTADELAARELTADQQVKQAIDRLSFGPRPGDYDRVRAMGVDRWVAEQLDPARIPDAAADRFEASFPLLALSATELNRELPNQNQLRKPGMPPPTPAESAQMRQISMRSRKLITDLQAAKVGRAVVSERQLEEVMTDFWFNHFNVYIEKVRHFTPEYERDVIRPYALGDFRTLLGAVAHSPAMLFYLDNWESRANPDEPVLVAARDSHPSYGPPRGGGRGNGGMYGRGGYGGSGTARGAPPSQPRAVSAQRAHMGLNENFARELLELHTLGVDGGYTQEDVINVARILTGWTIDRPQQVGSFVFRPEWHDAGSKTVLGVYFPAGRGMEEGDKLLDLLAADPHTARHIATQLVQRFVSDTAPPELVARAADVFTRTKGDIRETLRVIVQSPEFFSRAAYRAKVKSPFRLVVSALRAMDAVPDTSPRTAQVIARLGEPLYLHLAPNGYPLTGESWINTGSILNRINFGLAVAAGRIPGATIAAWPEGAALEREPRDAQVDGVVAALLQGEAGPDTRRILEKGVNPMLASAPVDSVRSAEADSLAALADVESAMTGGMPGAMPEPRETGPAGGLKRSGVARGPNPLAQVPDLEGFAQIVGLALGAPEFQRH